MNEVSNTPSVPLLALRLMAEDFAPELGVRDPVILLVEYLRRAEQLSLKTQVR
jgi:hypothetical protein